MSVYDRLPVLQKLLLLVIGSALLLSIWLGVANSNAASRELTSAREYKLLGIAESRRDALKSYLSSIDEDIATVSTNPFTLEALQAFETGWNELGSGQIDTLQRLYITENPNPTGQKEELDFAADGSSYSAAHAQYHGWFRQFLRARGYYDIFLFSNDGSLVYSVFKELDYATNLRDGEYASSDLGNAFRAAADTLKPGEKAFFDFKPYAPSHGAPASFISTPIPDGRGGIAGVLVFQMPIDNLNAVMQSSAGLGDTGETFVVGTDGYMRTDAPRADESTILATSVDPTLFTSTGTTSQIAQGKSYKGQYVFAASAPLEFHGTAWGVVAQIDRSEALVPVSEMRTQTVIISLVGLLIFAGIGAYMSRRISRPLTEIADVTQSIAEGARDIDVPFQNRKDEMGPLARAIELFRIEMIKSEQIAEEQKQKAIEDKLAAEERAKRGEHLKALTARFDEMVSAALSEVSAATSHLDESAAAMAAIAEETASQSESVVSASQIASSNVQSVAAATEELSVSVEEIQSKVGFSRDATSTAVSRAQIMSERVASLETAAASISDVVGLITNIAAQTNLLALNATIEAARAGEAGKGFAVVASEVKALANQTANATDDISRQISAIQSTTQSSVEGIQDILTTISELETISADIAAAIDQQTSATRQISSNIQEAAGGVQQVDSNIEGVSTAANEAGSTAAQVRNASDTLTRQSNELKEAVEHFLGEVRVA